MAYCEQPSLMGGSRVAIKYQFMRMRGVAAPLWVSPTIESGSKVGLTTTWCCAIPCNVVLLSAVITGDMQMLNIAVMTCLV